jgi:hypothetical protein
LASHGSWSAAAAVSLGCTQGVLGGPGTRRGTEHQGNKVAQSAVTSPSGYPPVSTAASSRLRILQSFLVRHAAHIEYLPELAYLQMVPPVRRPLEQHPAREKLRHQAADGPRVHELALESASSHEQHLRRQIRKRATERNAPLRHARRLAEAPDLDDDIAAANNEDVLWDYAAVDDAAVVHRLAPLRLRWTRTACCRRVPGGASGGRRASSGRRAP